MTIRLAAADNILRLFSLPCAGEAQVRNIHDLEKSACSNRALKPWALRPYNFSITEIDSSHGSSYSLAQVKQSFSQRDLLRRFAEVPLLRKTRSTAYKHPQHQQSVLTANGSLINLMIFREWIETKVWRRDRDSNPGYPFEYAAFPRRYIQPLCHLSGPSLESTTEAARKSSRAPS